VATVAVVVATVVIVERKKEGKNGMNKKTHPKVVFRRSRLCGGGWDMSP